MDQKGLDSLRKKLGAIDLTDKFNEEIAYRISLGNIAFDLATGGGIPCSKLTEMYGPTGAGKSRFACQVIANTINAGGIGVLIDTERALGPGLAELTDLDVHSDRFFYPDPNKDLDSIEDVFKIMQTSTVLLRETNPDGLLTIVWDSPASAPGMEDIVGELGNNMAAARRAKLIKDGLAKLMPVVHKHKICLIFINQTRDAIGVLYGDKTVTTGGKSLGYSASLRIHIKMAGKIKDEVSKEQVGNKGRIIVEKSRVGMPYHRVEFEMFVNKPLDPFSGLLDYLVRHPEVPPYVEKAGQGWYEFRDSDKKFQEENFIIRYDEMMGKE